jgi:tetratricopeptide (TPR) repeat protein
MNNISPSPARSVTGTAREKPWANLGNAYKNLGETRRAIEFHEQDLAIAREIGDRRGEGTASWNLGLALEKQGELARAIQLMQVCVDYERELGHPDAEADAARVEEIRARLAQLWQSWAEGGPQGPIEDEDELA